MFSGIVLEWQTWQGLKVKPVLVSLLTCTVATYAMFLCCRKEPFDTVSLQSGKLVNLESMANIFLFIGFPDNSLAHIYTPTWKRHHLMNMISDFGLSWHLILPFDPKSRALTIKVNTSLKEYVNKVGIQTATALKVSLSGVKNLNTSRPSRHTSTAFHMFYFYPWLVATFIVH